MRAFLVVLLVAGCSGEIVGGAPRALDPTMPEGSTEPMPEPEPVIRLPAAVACNGTATGRSYAGFDGVPLDADRLPLAAGQDTARIRDGSDLGNFFESRGIAGATINNSITQTFGVGPEHWYTNTQASFASVYAAYAMAFHGCLEKMQRPVNYHPFGNAAFAATATMTTAPVGCQVIARTVWRREMSADELAGCVDYALEVPTLEADVKRQWAYVCASVAGAASFLIY